VPASALADRLRRAIRFTDKYLTLAGRSCCVGRSQLGMRRTLGERYPECAVPPKKEVIHDA
jgi:hypothetical protein